MFSKHNTCPNTKQIQFNFFSKQINANESTHVGGLAGSSGQIETGHLNLHGHLGVGSRVFGSDTGPLDDDLLVAQLHSVQSRNRLPHNRPLAKHFWRSRANQATDLIGDGHVSVLAEGVAFRESGGRVFDQVEGAQLSERHEQLFDLQFNETICVLS